MGTKRWIALCAILAACDNPLDPERAVDFVVLTPARVDLVLGQEHTLNAVAKNMHNAEVAGRRVTWKSNKPLVATVSAAGVVTAKGKGTARITATVGGESASTDVSVRFPVFQLSVIPASLVIGVGQSRVYQVSATDSLGETVSGFSPTWTSSAPGIAAFTGSGVSRTVHGISPGVATISVAADNKVGSATIVVQPVAALSGIWDFVEHIVDSRTGGVCSDTGSVVFVQVQATLTGGADQTGTCITGTQSRSNARSTTVANASVVSNRVGFMLTANPSTHCTYAGDAVGDPAETMSGTMSCTMSSSSYNGTWTAVRDQPISSITFAPPVDALLRGTTRQVNAQLTNAAGQRAFRRPVEWVTDDFNVAVVLPSGSTSATLRAVGTGTATVSARVGARIARADISVTTIAFSAVSAGGWQTCGAVADGSTYCWGYEPGRAAAGPVFARIAVGAANACGLDQEGAAYCWNTYPSAGVTQPPPAVPGGFRFTSISAGGYSADDYNYYYDPHAHMCGTTADAKLYCWGDNAFGQLGNGSQNGYFTTPTLVAGDLRFAAVSSGAGHTCALTEDGRAFCWGENNFGQLGNNTLLRSTIPVAVLGGLTFTSISAGAVHTCGLTASGSAWCWGSNQSAQLGAVSGMARVPIQVTSSLAFATLAAGYTHTCALTTAGAPYCWGLNNTGQLGRNPGTAAQVPTAVPTSLTFSTLSSGSSSYQTCGRASDARFYCWGPLHMVGAGFSAVYGPVAVVGQQ